MASGSDVTAPLEPGHTYVPNKGYVTGEAPGGNISSENPNGSAHAEDDQEDDEDLDDLFDDEYDQDLDVDDYAASNPADFTKAYNRQRKIDELSAGLK